MTTNTVEFKKEVLGKDRIVELYIEGSQRVKVTVDGETLAKRGRWSPSRKILFFNAEIDGNKVGGMAIPAVEVKKISSIIEDIEAAHQQVIDDNAATLLSGGGGNHESICFI